MKSLAYTLIVLLGALTVAQAEKSAQESQPLYVEEAANQNKDISSEEAAKATDPSASEEKAK